MALAPIGQTRSCVLQSLGRPREALRSRPRPRIRPRGVMEYWSVGVLRQFGIAPRVRGVGSAFRAALGCCPALGYSVRPFHGQKLASESGCTEPTPIRDHGNENA